MTQIKLQNVSIDYPLIELSRSIKKSIFKNATSNFFKQKNLENMIFYRGLNKVNLDLKPGDRIGIKGPNGSGKTTLLRTIAGIYTPSEGKIDVQGNISSLLDINLGMDLELSGIDNIYLKSILLKKKPEEILTKIDEIINFSSLKEYINLPLKRYSSGMIMRLAFSIVTSFECSILLMDEWLSVGDKEFNEKAKEKLSNFIKSSEILILASHSEKTLADNCNKIYSMKEGKLI